MLLLPMSVAKLDYVDNCRIFEGSDRVARQSGSLRGSASFGADGTVGGTDDVAVTDDTRFRFDDYVVDAGTEVDLNIVCDISDKAETGHQFVVKAVEANDDKVEYDIGKDDFTYAFTDTASSTLSIAESGTLGATMSNPDDNNTVFAVATGSKGADGIEVLEIEFEAEEERHHR